MKNPYLPLLSPDARLANPWWVFCELREHYRKRKDPGFYLYPSIGIPDAELDEMCDRTGTPRAMPFERYEKIHNELADRARKIATRAGRRLAEIARINRRRFGSMDKEEAQAYIIGRPRHRDYQWYEWSLPHGLTIEIVGAKTDFDWHGRPDSNGRIPGTCAGAVNRYPAAMAA